MTQQYTLDNTGRWIKRGFFAALFSLIALLVASCGGGGASAPTTPGSAPLTVTPGAADAFGDVAITFNIAGGKSPYTASSNNSAILPIPTQVDGSKLTITPKNPAADTPVVITFRDSVGVTVTAAVNVKTSTINNTLTVTPSSAGQQCSGICSGGDGVVAVQALNAGVPQSGRQVKFDAFQGDYDFVTPGTNALVSTITVATDSQGFARAVIRARNAAPSQSAILQVTDVPTNQTRRFVFAISQAVTSTAINIIPASTNWTSPFRDACVTGGISTHYIFGGTPPYDITSTSPDFATFAPSRVLKEGGAVTVVTTGLVCSSTGSTFIVRDASARNATFTVSNVVGPSTGPSVGSAISVSPPTVTPSALGPVTCGSSASSFVVQDPPPSTFTGTLTLSATSLEPNRVSAIISNGILTVTRAANGVGGASSVTIRVSNTVNFTDVAVSLSGTSPFGCGQNAGNTPISVTTSASVGVTAGQLAPQAITGGTGPYTITSASGTIAQVSADGVTFGTTTSVTGNSATFIIRGVASGVTFVTVTDSTGSSTLLVVTVSGSLTGLTISPNTPPTATVKTGTTGSFSISGGVAPYTVTGTTPNVVSAVVTSGNVLAITAGAVGTGTVTISDSASPASTSTINVTITP